MTQLNAPSFPADAYRGRLAPSPTGYLHLGHARTFWTAQTRARAHGGTLVLRNEDLDASRCRPEFVSAMYEDLSWFGFEWQEGPDVGGKHGPYLQSERRQTYMETFTSLRAGGFLYPCTCSRQDVLRSLQAPHAGEDEPIYPGTCRSKRLIQRGKEAAAEGGSFANSATTGSESATHTNTGMRINWRFAIPEGERVTFVDENYGPQEFVAGKDFGDFVVWRHDDIPSYQLAVVVDDVAMRITEVVRGEDLLRSTARQLLLYRALNCPPPRFYHCPLVLDETGQRMAKRHDALSLRALRTGGATPESLRCGW